MDEEDYDKLTDHVLHKEARSGYSSLSNGERLVYHIWKLFAEVNNGGFTQYFHNSNGGFAVETLKNLKYLGEESVYGLLQAACQIYPQGVLEGDANARREHFMSLDFDYLLEFLGPIDMQFYKHGDPWEKVLEFVRSHPKEFEIRF